LASSQGDGSALFYARRIADKIGRDIDYGSLTVEVRSREGKLLATVAPSEGRGCEQFALIATAPRALSGAQRSL